jgi:hypothetical protein
MSSHTNGATHLFITSITLFTNPTCFKEISSLLSTTLVILLHTNKLLNKKIHIVANFRFALSHLFVSLRWLWSAVLLKEARVLPHSVTPLFDYLNFHLNPVDKHPLYS